MMDVHKRLDVAEGFLIEMVEIVGVAIKSGDWQVDGACDPEELIRRIHSVYTQIMREAHPN